MRLSTLVPLAVGLNWVITVAGLGASDWAEDAVVPQLEVRDLEVRSLVDDIWNDIKNAATCTACEAILVLLKGAAALGDSFFVATFTEVCKVSNVEDDDVCEGVIAREGPIIAAALRGMKINSKTSKIFCVTFLGLCPYPDVDAWTVPFPSPKPATSRPLSSGQTPLKVVHYSDIHIDPFYTTGSNANCTKPICCRPYTSSDSPGKTNTPAGPNGDHKCDTPISLEESMYAAIHSLVPDAAFALFTGDIVDHAVWNTTQPQNTLDINDAYARMNRSGLPLVYGTTGNHEAHPVNAFQPGQSLAVYDTLSRDWAPWIGSVAASTADKTGAYSVAYPGGKLKVISLNTNMYYIDNFWMYEEPMERDPNGQFAWLVGELDAAEKAGQRVFIIGHMPMGLSDAFHNPSNYFDQIVRRYEATIAAMFFGHTHVDHFEISYADYGARSYSNALAVSYIAPSLTPTSGMPSFRVYDVDPVTFGVLDVTTYAADMNSPSFQTTGPVWSKYYSAKSAYGSLVSPPLTSATAELTPAFWHNVTDAFAASQTAFDAYVARKSRGWNVASCTGSCRDQEICALRSARAQDNCVVPSPGVHFGRRALGEAAERADRDCGTSVTREAISLLVARKDVLELVGYRLLERRAEVGVEA